MLASLCLAAIVCGAAPESKTGIISQVPDFPAELRRTAPVADIQEAAVYTINETIDLPYGIALARKVGSDVLIRGWFKWHNAPNWAKMSPLADEAHRLGALFGGGVTCSALYHGENGLPEDRVLAMATRGTRGELIDAWKTPGCRHGSLSNRAYLDYVLSWCVKQIDAGADYLFMDEINAVLHPTEGFDDDSVRDFREHLLKTHAGLPPSDPRWQTQYRIDLANKSICPDGTMRSFRYREYLQALNLADAPHSPKNPLSPDWHTFRQERDDLAWKWLSDSIRAYAKTKGRRVLLSGNGLARYVDLQVLGVWGDWDVKNGRVDLAESQIEGWGATVGSGWALAEQRVPVVLFHDWGFNGFPWMKVPPEDRRLWMRVRGAEIYAAGGFFAFPVHGPMGQDALNDGTLAEIGRQSAFYQRNRDLYLRGRLLSFEPLKADRELLSLSLWEGPDSHSLLLHVINRNAKDGQLQPQSNVALTLPTAEMPRAVRIVSADWPGEVAGQAKLNEGRLVVTLPRLEAYAVAILDYDRTPATAMQGRRIIARREWARPQRNEFLVHATGAVSDPWALNGLIQGRLHSEMRNPPTFVVNMPHGGKLCIHVRAVATQGARLDYLVDGQRRKSIELPDKDGRNDSSAKEYDQTFELPVPAGRHRLTLDNTGGDWMVVGWLAFEGQLAEP